MQRPDPGRCICRVLFLLTVACHPFQNLDDEFQKLILPGRRGPGCVFFFGHVELRGEFQVDSKLPMTAFHNVVVLKGPVRFGRQHA